MFGIRTGGGGNIYVYSGKNIPTFFRDCLKSNKNEAFFHGTRSIAASSVFTGSFYSTGSLQPILPPWFCLNPACIHCFLHGCLQKIKRFYVLPASCGFRNDYRSAFCSYRLRYKEQQIISFFTERGYYIFRSCKNTQRGKSATTASF